MIFQVKMREVLDGSKTQTRRRFLLGDRLMLHKGRLSVVKLNGFPRWSVGKSYAIHPYRTAKSVPGVRLLITCLRLDRQPLRICDEDAKAEGFCQPSEFVAAWNQLHRRNAKDPCWVVEFQLVRSPAEVVT